MKAGQDAIYYIAGDDAAKLAKSPHLEGFKAKGVEVLLLSDHVDEFWLQHITQHDGKPFKSITRGAADLDLVEADETKEDTEKPDEADLSALIAAIKAELGEAVKDVRPSKRLTDSPVCLIADEGDMDVNLERLLKRHGQLVDGMPRVLELNPSHALIATLATRSTSNAASEDDLLKDAAHLLLDQARIVEGEVPTDPSDFARRLGKVMARAFDA
jgi:molecular chaperone HtpG